MGATSQLDARRNRRHAALYRRRDIGRCPHQRCDTYSLSLRRRSARWCIAALVAVGLGSGTPAFASSSLPWPKDGQSALAVDGLGMLVSGPVARPQPIASVAKVMAAYQVLNDHPLRANEQGPTITVLPSEAAAYRAERSSGQTLVPVVAGEKLTERQALEAMLLPSANNMARILARWDSGSIGAFLSRENRTAARLGLTHTRYTDPAGVESHTVSTAPDQIRLAQAAMALPAIASVVGETWATIPVAGAVHKWPTASMNQLLGHDAVSVKTGWTGAAGSCLVFAARAGGKSGTGRMMYGAILGQRGSVAGSAATAAARLIGAARATIRNR